jgi:hypothetical protein
MSLEATARALLKTTSYIHDTRRRCLGLAEKAASFRAYNEKAFEFLLKADWNPEPSAKHDSAGALPNK